MPNNESIGALRFDESELTPTEVGRKNKFKVGRDLNFRSFDIGAEVAKRRASDETPYENYYRHFKADLARLKSALKAPNGGEVWEMKTMSTDHDRGHGGLSEVIDQDGSDKSYFNPQTASHVFLRNLCVKAAKQVKRITGLDEDIKIHLTAPAYEDDDRSQRYRDHIREVIDLIQGEKALRRVLQGVEFVVGRDDFLYEPYGVYYYYAFIQESVSLGEEEAGKTYLIYDMGGSTTDLGIVQINRKGEVTTVYPICRSIDCAGAYFDRFILKYIRGDKRLKQVSAKWNPEFEKIEKAKISLCEGKKDRVEVDIKGKSYILTRSKLKEAFQELWKDDNRPLGKGLRGFVEQVQAQARENSLFLDFDEIEKVFLAGGSIGLPGLRELLFEELGSNRFGLVPDQMSQQDFFESPTLAPPSSIAALGQAAELANSDDSLILSRAEKLFARIEDENENAYVFRPRYKNRGLALNAEEKETPLFDVDDLRNRIDEDNSWADFEDNEYQNYNPSEDKPFPTSIKVFIRNSLSEYPEQPNFEEPIDEDLISDAEDKDYLRFNFSCQAQDEEDSVRVKPFVYANYKGAENKRRLYRNQGSEQISLKPQKQGGNAHICIDLGMNNTAVALCTPGRSLPEGISELNIIHPSQKENTNSDALHTNGDGSMGAKEPATCPQTREATTENGSTLQLSDEVVQGLIETLQQIANRGGTASTDIDKILDGVRSSIHDAGEKIEETIKNLLETRVSPESDQQTSSKNPAEKILDSVDDNDNGFATTRATEDDFQSFSDFVNDHEKGLHYPTSILSAVWMHARSTNNRLAILAGPPGCGKSSLIELTAEFFNRDREDDWTAYHLLQPVSPTWFSPSSLLGSYSEIDGKYHSTEFLRLMMTAEQHYEYVKDSGDPRLFFVCLDEFNLAQPEQYMADILSKMEAKASREIMLCRKDKMGWGDDLKVGLTPNLKLFATINTDVSTKMLSPKVLDRSVFIRLTPTFEDLEEVSNSYANSYGVSKIHDALVAKKGEDRDKEEDEPLSLLGDLVMIGRYGQSPVGYRVFQQIYEYASHHPRLDGDLDGVIDEIICNFFLPKLPGAHAAANPVKYTDAISEKQAARVHKCSKASQILKSIKGGVPGQTAI